jgi:hypothetical protein
MIQILQSNNPQQHKVAELRRLIPVDASPGYLPDRSEG